MMKSLFAGAAALSLIAGAAFGQQAYDSTTYGRSTTTTVAPATSSTMTVQRSVNPYTGATVERRETTQKAVPSSTATTTYVNPDAAYDPSRVTDYRQRTVMPNGQTIEKSYSTETTPSANQTTTYSRTTTITGRGD